MKVIAKQLEISALYFLAFVNEVREALKYTSEGGSLAKLCRRGKHGMA